MQPSPITARGRQTDPEAGHKGMSAFIVEREWPGVTTRRPRTSSDLGGSTGELFFENVEVPADNLLGEEVRLRDRDVLARQGRFTVAAGASRDPACLEKSVEYARERETFGQPIGRYQFVRT